MEQAKQNEKALGAAIVAGEALKVRLDLCSARLFL